MHCMAQTVVNPVFDRSDAPAFRVDKVEITPDTTYVYCSYRAEDHSWACISRNTCIEDVSDGTRYPILNVSGIPFSPEKRNFEDSTIVQVSLCFPHINSEKINIIENDDNESFNIYGINLKRSYNIVYTEKDLDSSFYTAKNEEELGNWDLAIENFKKQLDASKFLYGERSKECAWAMFNILLDYGALKQYENGIEIGEKVIEILNEYSKDSLVIDVTARTYGSMSVFYSLLKNDELASRYQEKSVFYRRLKPGVGAVDYEEYLLEASKMSYYNEDYPKALMYGKELADIYEERYLKDKYEFGCSYLISLSNLCEYYRSMAQFEEAIKCGKKALEIVDNKICDKWGTKYHVYNILAGALLSTGQIDDAIDYLRKIVSNKDDEYVSNELLTNSRMLLAEVLLEHKQDTLNSINEYNEILKTLEDSIKVGKPHYYEYTEILHKLSKVYKGYNDSLCLYYLKKNMKFIKEVKGENSVAYANSIIQLINNVYVKSLRNKTDIDSMFVLLRNSSEIIKRHIINTQLNISKSERELYWNKYKYFFTWTIPTICGSLIFDAGHSLAYDVALFYKGMLLSSEKEFRDVILSSRDSTLIDVYKQYSQDLSLLESQYAANTTMNSIDSLKIKIKEEEFLQSQKVTGFNRLYKGTNYTWQEVRDKLNDNDVAIEIVSYNTFDDSNTYYDAYIINNKSQAPKLVFLFDELSYKKFSKGDSIDYYLSSWIWENENMFEEIKDARNIYFSPSGLLNTIGIEYLPISGGRYINERFNIIRLSSTRELCQSNEHRSIKDVCLYGGLDYSSQKEERQLNITDTIPLTRSVVESIEKRGGFDPLIGSKEEIEQVSNEISSKGIKCRTFTGAEGTETSFKNLSEKHIDIIHLSTHGMYVPSKETDNSKNYSFILSDNAKEVDEEDQSLTQSFLVMSGGNLIMHADKKQKGENDGILTALEVSHLDFSNLGLVVLSACETALGKVESEGVYGLQRGFKKAGANTILMSLDKVDDEATKILMVEFYRNLMNGKTKQQSLKEAQKHLRQVNNGKYDKPEYWASFIMLDGLN